MGSKAGPRPHSPASAPDGEAQPFLVFWLCVWTAGGGFAVCALWAVIRPARDSLEQRAEDNDLDILGKRVLTEQGTELGTVTDVDFDPETGAVTTLITKTDTIAGQRLIGLGGYAAVVSS